MSAVAYSLALVAGALAGPVAVAALVRAAPSVAGGADAVAARTAAVVEAVLAPLRRAGSHGSDPSAVERRRLRLAGAVGGGLVGLAFAGGWVTPAASAGAALWLPRVATWRRTRYGRRVEAGAASAALAISGALAGGGSVRGAIGSAAHELDGPISIELHRTAVELEAGASLDGALDALVERAPSRSVRLIAASVQLQRRSGGDLAALLRRIAVSLEDEARAAAEAGAATAQARVTSTMVLALPPAGIALAELASPGLLGRMLGTQVGAALVILALGLQVLGALAVRRLARISP